MSHALLMTYYLFGLVLKFNIQIIEAEFIVFLFFFFLSFFFFFFFVAIVVFQDSGTVASENENRHI